MDTGVESGGMLRSLLSVENKEGEKVEKQWIRVPHLFIYFFDKIKIETFLPIYDWFNKFIPVSIQI